MKVVFLSALTGLGGGEVNFISLIDALKEKHGVEPVLITSNPGLLNEVAEGGGIETITIKNLRLRSGRIPRFSPWAYKRLSNELGRIGPAVVHSNDWETLFYVALVKFFTKAEYRIVWTCNGWWYPKLWPATWGYRQADIILAVSDFVMDRFTRKFNVDEGRVKRVYLGVDIKRFSPSPVDHELRDKWGVGPETVAVGLIGRFQRIKGHLRLLEAVKGLGGDVRVIFVGDNTFSEGGDRRNMAAVERFIKKNKLEDRVVFAGFRKDIERVIAALDIIVSPSDFESFGLVNIEAMAGGRAVLSTSVGGPAEVITSDKDGVLFNPKFAGSLRAEIERLVDSKELRKSLGENGHETTVEKFSLANQTEAVLGVYKELASR